MFMKYISRVLFSVYLLTFCCGLELFAQGLNSGTLSDGRKSNSIQTAMPFLQISPDARAGAMGDVGVATNPDIFSTHWNPSKMAFLAEPSSISLSYSPWLKNLVPDIDFAYLTAYRRLDERSTLAGSLRFFSLGNIQLTDANQQDLGTYNPNEFALDLSYSRRFGESFALGTTMRYISSNLSNGQFYQGEQLRPASAFAVDVSAYFKKPVQMLGNNATWSLGMNISNIGTKVSYAKGGAKYFLPTNLKLGTAVIFDLENSDKFTLALDLNKLLVPTNPEYDSNGNIVKGENPDRSVISAIFGSFSDAPGGVSEEIREINYSFGAEYLFNDQLALRTGYFYEHPTKGDRQFFTVGTGFNANKFSIDLAYILANQAKSPLANTLRFSLAYKFEKKQKNKLP